MKKNFVKTLVIIAALNLTACKKETTNPAIKDVDITGQEQAARPDPRRHSTRRRLVGFGCRQRVAQAVRSAGGLHYCLSRALPDG